MAVPEELRGRGAHAREVQVAVEAALAGGALIKEAFSQRSKAVEQKTNHADLVTATDKAVEALILGRIRAAFPEHGFIGEEGSAEAGATSALGEGPTWMVDPLDGTTNFVHGFPWVCTSIGLTVAKRVVVGVVYNPVMGELFVGAEGRGAFLNGARISASGAAALAGALVGSEVGTCRDGDVMDATFGRLRALTCRARSVRCTGSCALGLANVAMGRTDAFYEVNFGGCWDCAAGALLVSEAGGCVLDPAGGPFDVMARRVLAAGSEQLGAAVAAVLAECRLGALEPGPPGPGTVASVGKASALGQGEEGRAEGPHS